MENVPKQTEQGTATQLTSQVPPKMPAITQPMTLDQLRASPPGSNVDFAMTVAEMKGPQLFHGFVLESDEAEPFNAYNKTKEYVTVEWSSATRFIMGTVSEVRDGALLRVGGTIDAGRVVHAGGLVILTKVARVIGPK